MDKTAIVDNSNDRELVPRSIGRVLDLLEIVMTSGSCNLTTAATRAGLTPTTARRYLRALEARRYLYRNTDGWFSAGSTMMRLAAPLHDTGPLETVVSAAQPHLNALAAETGESVYLALGGHQTATYIATAESPSSIRHVGWVGQHIPLSGTALGAALANPGVTVARTGAVEADISAISRALTQPGNLPLAISLVGPKYRVDAADPGLFDAALTRVEQALAFDLGLERTDSV